MTIAEMMAAERLVRARSRYRASLVVLLLSVLVAGLLVWRDLRDDRPYARAGLVSQAAEDVPAQWRRTVLLPGERYEVTAAVREDVTDDPGVQRTQAPDGGAFVGLDIHDSERSAPDIPDIYGRGVASDSQPMTFTVVADGRRYPLATDDTAEDAYDRGKPVRLPFRGWLAVAGSADDLVLEVVWKGRTQRVDLRTGARTPGDFAALYSQRSTRDSPAAGTSCGTATWTPGWRAGSGIPAACSYRADRLAWSNTKGWARAGRQWLALTIATRVPSDLIRRVGSRDVDFYASGYYVGSGRANTAAESPDRLDGDRPVALSRVDVYGEDDTVVLLFDVPRRDAAHTAVVTQLVDADERVEPTDGEYEGGVRQTWTVRIPA